MRKYNFKKINNCCQSLITGFSKYKAHQILHRFILISVIILLTVACSSEKSDINNMLEGISVKYLGYELATDEMHFELSISEDMEVSSICISATTSMVDDCWTSTPAVLTKGIYQVTFEPSDFGITFKSVMNRTLNLWFMSSDGVQSFAIPLTITADGNGDGYPDNVDGQTLNDDVAPTAIKFELTSTTPSFSPDFSFDVGASDNIGVTGYCVQENNKDTPLLSDKCWVTVESTKNYSASIVYTATKSGVFDLNIRFKDNFNNISKFLALDVPVEFDSSDKVSPTFSDFTIITPSPVVSPEIRVGIDGEDNIGVVGFCLKENDASPPVSDDKCWISTENFAGYPSNIPYTLVNFGSVTISAWIKDVSGNISNMLSAVVTYDPQDTEEPLSSVLVIIQGANTDTANIQVALKATDNEAVAYYCIKESESQPASTDNCWTAVTNPSPILEKTVPYTLSSSGLRTIYAWFKDSSGRSTSQAVSASIMYTPADLTAPIAISLTINTVAPATTGNISLELKGTDNVNLASYCLKQSITTKPAGEDACWTALTPTTSYTGNLVFSLNLNGDGLYEINGWLKDTSGNISGVVVSDSIAYKGSDTSAPLNTSLTAPNGQTISTASVTIRMLGTDNDGITAYCIKIGANQTAPNATDSCWVTFDGGTTLDHAIAYNNISLGTNVLNNWLKDASGNVSEKRSLSVTYTPPDTTKPIINSFVSHAGSSTTTEAITLGLEASDSQGVTGYCIKSLFTVAPTIADSCFIDTQSNSNPTHTISFKLSVGANTIYAWVKDSAGNISDEASLSVSYVPPDTTKPIINSFTSSSGSNVSTSSTTLVLNATDSVGVTGYCVKHNTSTTPTASNNCFIDTSSTTILSSELTLPLNVGSNLFYAWVKDVAGNVSDRTTLTVTYTLPDTSAPVVTAFSIPSTSNLSKIQVTSLTGTDNIGVSGYCITESSTQPALTDDCWVAVSPSTSLSVLDATYEIQTQPVGVYNVSIYAWLKDETGNVSSILSSSSSSSGSIYFADPSLPKLKSLNAGTRYVCATDLNDDGYCWGTASMASGFGTIGLIPTPTQLNIDQKFKKIVTGYEDHCALGLDNGLWCWGISLDLTKEDYNDVPYFLDVYLTDVDNLRFHSCGIDMNNSIWCWGAYDNGELGNGEKNNGFPESGPVRASTDEDFSSVSVGNENTCAISLDNKLWCWGAANNGLLGNVTVDLTVPNIMEENRSFKKVSIGKTRVCAIDLIDQVWCRGGGASNTTFVKEDIPVTFVEYDLSNNVNCGLDALGDIYCKGDNQFFEGGNADPYVTTTYNKVISPVKFQSMSMGSNFICAIDVHSTGWCWGNGTDGELGNGEALSSKDPVRIDLKQ